jgi:ketosteroid isomerase-like protein
MSQQNVESLRRALNAFNRRVRAAWVALCDPEFEAVPSRMWPETDSLRGPDAAWNFYLETDEPWEQTPYEYVEVIDAGHDKVVAHQRREMRGKASGAGVVYDFWLVATFRNGKALRAEYFDDRQEAFEAAGLKE